MKKFRKATITGIILMFVMTTCFSSYAFADNRPSGGGMGGGPNGQQQGINQQGGYGMGQMNGQGDSQMGGQMSGDYGTGSSGNFDGMQFNGGNGMGNSDMDSMPNNSENGMPNNGGSGMPDGNFSGMPGGNNQMRPDAGGIDFMAVEAYLATDDVDENIKNAYDALKDALSATPGNDGSIDIDTLQNALKDAIENAGIELSDYASNRAGLNLQAVEEYLATDDADENVQSAYDALQSALTGEPEEDVDNDIAALESSLQTALENAGLNLDDYMNEDNDFNKMENQPGGAPQNMQGMGINIKAVEAYLATDDADENVQSAYDALQSALTGEPGEDVDNDIAALESSLQTALENAGVNIEDYDDADMNLEEGSPSREIVPKDDDTSNLTEQENNILRSLLNKILSLFK